MVVNKFFCFGIQRASGFVQNENSGIRGERPGNFQALPLSAAEVSPAFHDQGFVSAWPVGNVVMYASVFCGMDERFVSDGVVPQREVLADGALKQENILIH